MGYTSFDNIYNLTFLLFHFILKQVLIKWKQTSDGRGIHSLSLVHPLAAAASLQLIKECYITYNLTFLLFHFILKQVLIKWKHKKKSLNVFKLFNLLRKEGDSNPRYPYEYDSLANCWFQPLTHPSLVCALTFCVCKDNSNFWIYKLYYKKCVKIFYSILSLML